MRLRAILSKRIPTGFNSAQQACAQSELIGIANPKGAKVMLKGITFSRNFLALVQPHAAASHPAPEIIQKLLQNLAEHDFVIPCSVEVANASLFLKAVFEVKSPRLVEAGQGFYQQ
jgi:hypothetical protein